MRIYIMLAMLMLVSACETIKGFGRDMSNAGSGLQKIAEETDGD